MMILESVAVTCTTALAIAGAYFSYEWFTEQLDMGIVDAAEDQVEELKASIAEYIETERVAIPFGFSWDISVMSKYGTLSLVNDESEKVKSLNFITAHREEESDEDYHRRCIVDPVRYISQWMEKSLDKEGAK